MRRIFAFTRFIIALAMVTPAWSASKPHVVFLGKAQTVKILVGRDESQSATMTVRPLYVDSKLKDYTTGEAHDITDRDFVVQRAYRINDALPGDPPKQGKWIWQRGDWLLVDRISGHIAQIKLPEFDPTNSYVSWYRDYAAYCGTSDDGARRSALVSQIGIRKPLFRKDLSKPHAPDADTPAADCLSAKWQRHPVRVTFTVTNAEPFTVNVLPRHAEELSGDSEADK